MKRNIAFILYFLISSMHAYAQNWVPVFWDDFNGTALDSSKWRVGYSWGRVNNTNTIMLNKNVSVANGELVFKALHEDFLDNGVTRTNTSGAVTSFLSFQKGAFAIRFKAPSLFWPAFWIYGAEGNEIDFFELGNDCNPILGVCSVDRTKMVHMGTGQGGGDWFGVNKNWDTDWHIIGGNWDGDKVDMYVDGTFMKTYRAHYKHDLAIIMDLEVTDDKHGGLHTKSPTPGDFPAFMHIDWVRVWAPLDCNTETDICTLDAEHNHIITGSTVVLAKKSTISTCMGLPCPANTDCEVTVKKGDHLDVYATEGIVLNPGFSVINDPNGPNSEAHFTAQIVPCNIDTGELAKLGLVTNPFPGGLNDINPPFDSIKVDLEIFPNPSSGIFNLRLLNIQGQTPYTMQVFNALGQVVFEQHSTYQHEIVLDMPGCRSGLYMIKVQANGQSVVDKIIHL